MPALLRPIARNQPFTPIIETMRGLWMGRTSTGAGTAREALIAAGWGLLILSVSVMVASRLYRTRTAQ